MDAKQNKSDVFNWEVYTKKELIHILIMHEIMIGKQDIFKTLDELQHGVNCCKYCKSMHNKDYLK